MRRIQSLSVWQLVSLGVVLFSQAAAAGAGPHTVRSLLQQGKIRPALREVTRALEFTPGDPELQCLLGDVQYRLAEFEAAETAYRAAVENNARKACGYLGLGRIASLRFERDSAMRAFAAAYQLSPSDPEVIWAYSQATPDLETQIRLMRRFVSTGLLAGVDRSILSDAVARIQVAEHQQRLNSRNAQQSRRSYRIPLERFLGAGSTPAGLLVTATFDGTRALRLVLDTGGTGILLNAKAIKGLKLTPIAQSAVAGFGSGRAKDAQIALAADVAIGELKLGSMPVQTVHPSVVAGADGIIGGDVFREFVLSIDARSLRLDLLPLDDDHAQGELPGRTIPVYAVNHFLLVQAAVDGAKPGYYLLDTGAAHTVIANRLSGTSQTNIALRGAQGFLDGTALSRPVSVRMGAGEWYDRSPISADFRQMSQRHGIEISGAIGYSLLSQGILTINYRDGVVRLTER